MVAKCRSSSGPVNASQLVDSLYMNYLFSPPFSLLQAPKELHTDQDSLGPALDKEPSKLYARKSILGHGSVFDYVKQIRYRWGKLQGALFKTRAWSYSMLA